MTLRKPFSIAVAILLVIAAKVSAEDAWKPLFNGTDLAGWNVRPEADHWSVRDGVIIGKNGPQKKGSVLWTDAKFGDFVFETEFRFEGVVDSGVFIKGETYQVNLGISSSLKTDMTCSIYAPKDGEKYPGKASGVLEAMKRNGWNRLRIEAMGRRITVLLNDARVLAYDTKALEETGPIGLQVHPGLDMKIEFRNPRISPRK